MDSVVLRQQVKEAPNAAERIAAFVRLLSQADLTWQDLLDGLGHPGYIAEISAVELHSALRARLPKSGIIMDRGFWEGMLDKRGISRDSVRKKRDRKSS